MKTLLKHVQFPIYFFLIAVIALLLRYPFLTNGHVDEVHTIGRALQIIYTGEFNPKFFKHPTGTMYLCIPAEVISLALISKDVGGRPGVGNSKSPLEYFKEKFPLTTYNSIHKGKVSPHWDNFRYIVRWFNVMFIPLQIALLAYIGKRLNLLHPCLSR